MARSHMLYDDQKLDLVSTASINWDRPWNAKQFQA
jgi:hypothetical protein